MSITSEHIERRNKFNDLTKKYQEAVEALRVEYHKQTKDLYNENRDLMKKLEEAFRAKVEREHTCTCCDPRMPTHYYLSDSGVFQATWEADNPRDSVDVNISIEELLGE